MLCKATEADLEQLIAFRQQAYGGNRQEAVSWLCGIMGLENILLLAKEQPEGPPRPAAMVGVVPVECGHRKGVWFCGMATVPALRGRGLITRLLDTCLRAYAANGCDFAVAAPETARAAQKLTELHFENRFPLRVIHKTIDHNLWARAEFDNMTVRRLMDTRQRYQPASVLMPESTMNEMISRLYRRGMTIVSNQRGYGLYCQKGDTLQFLELQADNDHSADLLLQAAREHAGASRADLLLAENQTLYLGEGKRFGYGMICFLKEPFPVTDVYFRPLV